MIVLLILWLVILLVCLAFGQITLNALSFVFKKEIDSQEVPTDLLLLLGLSSTTIIASYLSLLIPINWYLTGVFLIIALGFIFKNQLLFKQRWQNIRNAWQNFNLSIKILSVVIIVSVLLSGSLAVTHYDFGLFQLQYLKWIQNYSVVPGLGNLDHRFSFNSHYFIPSALFSVIASEEKVMCSLNNFFWAVLAIRLLYNTNKARLQQNANQLIFNGVLLSSFIYFTLIHLNGLSTDILNSILVCFTLLTLLEIKDKVEKDWIIFWVLPFVVCLAITFKLSSALLIITLAYLLYKNLKWAYFFYLGITGLIICIPFLTRNIILSGYLIFPFPPIDLFDVDWKVPMDVVVGEIANVKGWARVPLTKEASEYPLSQWIGIWFANKGLVMKTILLINAALVIPMLVFLKNKKFLLASVLGICLLNLVFWFSQAPFPRYVHGFLFVGFAIMASFIATPIIKYLRIESKIIFSGIVGILGILVLISASSLAKNPINSTTLFFPDTCPKMEVENYTTNTGLIIQTPKGDDKRCFNATLPCTHHPEKTLSLRGKTISEGFKTISD